MGPRIVTLGEPLVAFVRTGGGMADGGPFEAHVVGAESNVSVGLARLGHPTAMIGRVGADPLGELVLRQLRSDGVDVSAMTVDPSAPTGVLVRELRGLGPNEVVYHRAGSAGSRIAIADVRAAATLFTPETQIFHVSGITPALSPSAREAALEGIAAARRAGARVSFDVNLRRKLWAEDRAREVLSAFASAADIVLAGQEEAELLTGCSQAEAAAHALRQSGPSVAVVKLAGAGALAIEAEEVVRCEAVDVPRIADPVGAGDAFAAGFLSATLDGAALVDRLRRANVCAAYVIAHYGDLAGLPTRTDVDRFLGLPGLETLR